MKLSDYELKNLKNQQLVDAYDDIKDLVNTGKFAFPIVNAIPSWTADNGEMAFYDGGSSSILPGKRIYVRLSSSWEVFATAGNGVPAPPEGAIQFNSSNFFGGDADLIWNIASQSIATTGRIIIIGTGEISQLFIRQGALNQSSPILVIERSGGNGNHLRFTCSANMLLGDGANESSKVEAALCLSVKNGPAGGALNSVQLVAIDEQGYSNRAGLHICPEMGGGHFFSGNVIFCGGTNVSGFPGNYSVVISSGGVGTSEAASLALDGKTTNDSPSSIYLMANGVICSSIIFQNTGSVVGPSPANVVGQLRLSYSKNNQAGFVTIENSHIDGSNRISREDPLCVFKEQSLQISSGVTIALQRFIYCGQPVFFSNSNAVISTAVTLFVTGPGLSDTNVSIPNKYAIWVSSGAVRIDGNLIVGASLTPTNFTGTLFTSTAISVCSNNTNDTTLIKGVIGTTSLLANTLSEGRTIRLEARGYYNTPAAPGTAIMNVNLGGITVLSTSSQTITANASTFGWALKALVTCQTTGGAGTVFAQGNFDPQSSATAMSRWQMVGSSAVVINTTGANVVEITYQWGTANASNQLFMTNAVGELLN